MRFKRWLEDWHDYDPGWDYEEDEEPQPTNLVEKVVNKLKEELLPTIRLFRDFDVSYVTGLEEMGKYAYGTHSHPIIMLDMSNIQEACETYGTDCGIGIETTIVRELGHAIQEMFDLPMDEDEAEEFAKVWHRNRRSTDFWKERT